MTDTCRAALAIEWKPQGYRGTMQQLSAEDRPIWLRWLLSHEHAHEWYAYDVPIGGQDCDDPTLPEALRRQWRYCTAKRIDVLAQRGARFTIFEVRYQAGVSAIGALLVYAVLFAEHNPALAPPALHLITDAIAPDTRRAAEYYGITVSQV